MPSKDCLFQISMLNFREFRIFHNLITVEPESKIKCMERLRCHCVSNIMPLLRSPFCLDLLLKFLIHYR
jgi:hypothetical protein